MLIKRNVYFSAVDEETGEERLFSVNEIMTEEEYLERMYSEEQREFSSKAQKARRAKFDTSVAKEMYGGTEGATNDLNKLKRVGRAKAKQGTIRRVNGAGSSLSYDNYGTHDLSTNTKNVFVDASKGKKGAINEAEWRAIRQRVKEPANSERFKSMGRLVDKLNAIEKNAAKKAAGEKLAKNLKTAGKVGIGVAGAAGLGYGIKKAIDKNKKEHN